METILLNAEVPTRVRRVVRNGRTYLVAPLTLIVPGVLAGNQGPLYYPADEVARNPSDWNGFPITVYHPTSNGAPVSALAPGVLERQGVGHLENTHVTSNGRLRAEGWFDVELTQRVDPRVLASLRARKPMEISTGLYTDNEPAQMVGNHYPLHRGREYHYVARSYKPDHLAILPDQVGACSLNDGCGLMVNGAKEKGWSPLTNERADVTPEKACEILRDGTVHDQPLTEPQRGMFGAICGEREKQTKNAWEPFEVEEAVFIVNCNGDTKCGPCAAKRREEEETNDEVADEWQELVAVE